jgi:hypothetical protein
VSIARLFSVEAYYRGGTSIAFAALSTVEVNLGLMIASAPMIYSLILRRIRARQHTTTNTVVDQTTPSIKTAVDVREASV